MEEDEEASDGGSQQVNEQGKRKREDDLPMRRKKAKQDKDVENDISSGEESKRKPPSNGPPASVASKDEHVLATEQGGEQDGDLREDQGLDVEDGDYDGVHLDEEAHTRRQDSVGKENSGSHEAMDSPKQVSRQSVTSSHGIPRINGATSLSQTRPSIPALSLDKDGSPELGTETSNPKPIRKSMLSNGDYRADLPIRSDALEVVDRPDIPPGESLVKRKKSTMTMKRKRRSESHELFESAPSTPEGRTRPERLALDPLKVIEGPFGSTFVDGRSNARPSARADTDVSDDEEISRGRTITEVPTWPPRRKAHPAMRTQQPLNRRIFTPVARSTVLDTDYSPPETSRASQFARLERQGRRQEAFRLESKRVSLGGRTDFLHSIKKSSSLSTSRSKKTRVSPESPLGQVYSAPMLTRDSAPPSSPPTMNDSFQRGMSIAKALDEIGEVFKWCL